MERDQFNAGMLDSVEAFQQVHLYMFAKKPFEAEAIADALAEVYRLDR